MSEFVLLWGRDKGVDRFVEAVKFWRDIRNKSQFERESYIVEECSLKQFSMFFVRNALNTNAQQLIVV